jgi:hypothetical protein
MGLFDKVKDLVTDTVDTVINTVESTATNAVEAGESVLKGDLKGAGENLVEVWTEPVGEVLNGVSNLSTNVSGIAEELGVPSTITDTFEEAMKTPVNMADAVVTNTEEAVKAGLDGDIEGVVENVVEGHTETLHEGVVGAANTADAAGTDLGTVGTAIGGFISTGMYGDPTTGMAFGRKVGDFADKYANEGEITVDDAVRGTVGGAGSYLGGSSGAELADKIYEVSSDGHLSADDFIKLGQEVDNSQGYDQYIPNTNPLKYSSEDPSVYPPTNNQSPQSVPDYSSVNDSPPFVSELPLQYEPIGQAPKTNTEYGNFESLKNELGLGNMPTVSENSYTSSEDINGDGQNDYVYDRNNPAIPYHIAEDTNGDGKVDSIYNRYDTDGDGYYETVVEAFDENKDGKFDYAYKSYDTNDDGHHDTVDYAYGNNSDSDTDLTMLSNDSNNVSYDSDEYMGNNDDGCYTA